jgi:ATP-binding cassette, subfamily B, bacterial
MAYSADELPPSLGSLWRSLRLGYRAQPLLMVVALATTLLGALPDALFALGLARLVSAAESSQAHRILVAALALAALTTGNWLFGVVSGRINSRLTDRAAVEVESHMLRVHAAIPTIEHHERALFVDRLTLLRDHAPALSQLYQMLFFGLGVLLRLLVTFGLLFSIRPGLVLLGLLAVPPILVSHWRAGVEKRAEEQGAQDDRRARSLFLLGTTPQAAKEVRVGRVRHRLIELSSDAWGRRHARIAHARSVSAAWLALAYAAFAAALVAVIPLVATGPDAAGRAVLTLAAGTRLTQYLGQTVHDVHMFRAIWLDGARRLAWLEDFAAHAAVRAVTPAPDRLTSGIRLEDVSFRYPGADHDALARVTLDLPAGGVVAVVGENGAGKSTLVKLLCRFYEPSGGRILVDGVDLVTISPVTWRRRLTGAFQDFVKFEYPVRESVGIGDVSTLDDLHAVDAALGRAGATDLVAKLPQGPDTQLGSAWDGGIDLSQGQWQKIALARGFMRPRPLLLVLDEPTSALDAQAEWEIFERYAAAARDGAADGRVTILVSHRFSTVRVADLIVVLDGAHVAEIGSHQQLMARNGLYAELYGIQAKAYGTGAGARVPGTPQPTHQNGGTP